MCFKRIKNIYFNRYNVKATKFDRKKIVDKIPQMKDLLNPKVLGRFIASNGMILVIYEIINVSFSIIFYKLFQT